MKDDFEKNSNSDQEDNKSIDIKDCISYLPFELPFHIKYFENKPSELFELLFSIIDNDKPWCQSIIEEAKGLPKKLNETCVNVRPEDINSIIINEKNYKEHIKKNTISCLNNIAFQELIIADIIAYTNNFLINNPSFTSPSERTLTYPNKDINEGFSDLMCSLLNFHVHLTIISMLSKREQYIAARERGAKAKAKAQALNVENKGFHLLIKTLVTMLLNCETKRVNPGPINELINRYVERIMELWDTWPFFKLDRDSLQTAVTQIMSESGYKVKLRRSPFERQIGLPMSRLNLPSRPPESSLIQTKDRQAWQQGLSSALQIILKTKFDNITDEHIKIIESVSPADVQVWLGRTIEAETIDDVLYKYRRKPKR